MKCELPPPDLDKVVAKTEGYSGSDMRNFIQEACQVFASFHKTLCQLHIEGASISCCFTFISRDVFLAKIHHSLNKERVVSEGGI